MLEHDESVCPGCGEQAAGQQFCPSCGLLIGSFLAAPASATATPAESEFEPAPESESESGSGEGSRDVSYPSPSSPWGAPFTSVERGEVHDETPPEPAAETAEPATADVSSEPATAEVSSEPAPPSLAEPFVAQPLAVGPDEADDESAGHTAEIPTPEIAAYEAPAPVVHAISGPGSSDRRAAVACVAALLFVVLVLMNRGLRR